MKHSMCSKLPPPESQLMSVFIMTGLILILLKVSYQGSLPVVKKVHTLQETAAPSQLERRVDFHHNNLICYYELTCMFK